MKHPALPVSRAALAVMVVSGAIALAACSRPAPAPEPVRAVRTLTVGTDSAGGVMEYAADVRARVESRLGFRVGGKMTRRSVDLGDTVKAGQVLAQIDPQDLRLGQESARAGVNAAKVQFELAEADFKRFSDLRQQNFISAAELERREATLKSAQATYQQAQAQAGVQGNQAAYATLVADAAGVVTAVDAEPGQVIAAGAPVVRVALDGPRDVVFTVPEDRVAFVRSLEGSKGALQVQPWGGGAPVAATVREVAAAADPTTRTFVVKADVARGAGLQLGQTVTVKIEVPRTEGIVKLPLTAVFETGGKTAVWVLDDKSMTVQPQPVQVATADGNAVVVAAGLRPGQEVVSAGAHVLTPGQTVKRYIDPHRAAAALGSVSTPVRDGASGAGGAGVAAAAR
ncbi:efflux RND transporter periplasmic adaptor subunit [Rivibacter subsaxonicus]|uniref:RND family efflux transporter MFP subunit n=1 Tax=Rivibacter subsaxonicus TaxID=457575 RepID=A0A4Q7VNZ2_9BURK|nr:efflux RND transporter periplasmic adaptor subunit [Rivibacter subsaxonicus]RZT98062.1 RND family efflux transporter MFP subunit [Rivibacter subsaxonicus]